MSRASQIDCGETHGGLCALWQGGASGKVPSEPGTGTERPGPTRSRSHHPAIKRSGPESAPKTTPPRKKKNTKVGLVACERMKAATFTYTTLH